MFASTRGRGQVAGVAGNGGESIHGLRDAAILAVASDAMLRVSELAALRVGDIGAGEDNAATVTVRHSKTDQEGEGAVLFLGPSTAARISAWLGAAGVSTDDTAAVSARRCFSASTGAARSPPRVPASSRCSRPAAGSHRPCRPATPLVSLRLEVRWPGSATVELISGGFVIIGDSAATVTITKAEIFRNRSVLILGVGNPRQAQIVLRCGSTRCDDDLDGSCTLGCRRRLLQLNESLNNSAPHPRTATSCSCRPSDGRRYAPRPSRDLLATLHHLAGCCMRQSTSKRPTSKRWLFAHAETRPAVVLPITVDVTCRHRLRRGELAARGAVARLRYGTAK